MFFQIIFSYQFVIIADFFQDFRSTLEKIDYKLPADSNLNILIKIFLLLTFAHLFNWKAHFFCRFFDEKKEGLDIDVIHNFDVENLINKLDCIYFNISVPPYGTVWFICE